ncbi:hypothetical protein PybrP1_009967 [[Pythium] brassicae (nom. inval.)]|nr:hypothetical protein PybrP1_009967 [[Pythium] brassicae (nom. inval.)]
MASLGFCEEEVGFLRLLLLDTPTSEDPTANEEFFPSFQTPSYFLDSVGHADISTPTARALFGDDLLAPLDVAEAALWRVHESQQHVEAFKYTEREEDTTSTSERHPDPKSGRLSTRSENCTRGAQVTGRCKAHGGGVRCSVDGCDKSSQGSGLCRTHGGGKLCVFPGCKKGTQRRGRCSAHGGARRCTVDGCNKIDRGGGYCGSHKKMAAAATSRPATVWGNW